MTATGCVARSTTCAPSCATSKCDCTHAPAITIAGINSSGLFADERIRPAFSPEFRGRSVTGKNGHAIAQRKKLLANSAKQKIAIAAREVPSSNAAGKQNITSDEELI